MFKRYRVRRKSIETDMKEKKEASQEMSVDCPLSGRFGQSRNAFEVHRAQQNATKKTKTKKKEKKEQDGGRCVRHRNVY
jgi:hypothetical protein